MTTDTNPARRRRVFGIRESIALICGVLVGVVLADRLPGGSVTDWIAARLARSDDGASGAPAAWSPPDVRRNCGWHYLRIDERGWTTGSVGSYEDLDERLRRADDDATELAIPVFPTVYPPAIADKLYFDSVLESDIQRGDKVLVVGAGSGADAWIAWLKSQAPIHVIEINPMAVVNTRVTAGLGGFEVRAMTGDITTVALPEEFSQFDYVLWDMPFLEVKDILDARDFHDGDNGRLLTGFLDRLPSLLKPGGKAIIMNVAAARELITMPGVVTTRGKRLMTPPMVGEGGPVDADDDFDREFMLFVIPNP